MGFCFRKLYADLVTEDGTVCITYLAWVEAWGLRSAFGGVELYSPAGTREVLRARPPAALPVPGGDGLPVELRLEFPDGAFTLLYEPVHPPWTPVGAAPLPGLDWSVRVPRGTVRGRWSGALARPDLTGTGYVDWVELRRPTRWLGVRELEWGRVHLPESTLIFTGVRSRSDAWWRRVAHWPDLGYGAPLVMDDFDRADRENAVRIAFPRQDGPVLPDFVLQPERVLHGGSAIDPARSPGFFERLAFRLVTGPSDETRWISRARLAEGADTIAGVALHEVVRFGR